MKKSVRFLAFAVIAGSLFSMTACGEDPHTHTYASTWSKDATMHWHAGTCEHTNEMKDVSGHIDENKDGTCDVCLYDGGHVHTYEDTYSYDENNHWYAADCYHAVKDGVAPHVADALGYCVCGYKVGTPDVSTVAKAVEIGVSQGYRVNGGTVTRTTDNGSSVYTENGSYEIGTNYAHTLNYYMINSRWNIEELWYGKVNNDVVAFERDGDNIIWHNYEIEPEVINGWFFDGNETANITGKCYGITDYLESLYEVATIQAMDGTLVEGVEDGVYSFAFDVYHSDSSDDISTIAVEFTLGSTYFVETVNVSVERWYYAVEESEGVWVKPNTACDWSTEMSLTQRTGDPAVKMFDPAELILNNFDLYEGETKLEDTITITAGTTTTFELKDLAPETAADLAYESISIEGVNADTLEPLNFSWIIGGGDLSYSFVKSSKQLKLNFKLVGTYTLTISSRAVHKEYTLVVNYADATSISATVNGVNATTGSTFVDESFSFGTAVNAYAENLATAEFTSVPNGSTLTSADIRYNSSTGMFLFLPDVVGEYVIKVTSANNADLTANLTVTVTEKPSAGPALNGTWAGTTDFLSTVVTAVFTPDATPVAGAEFSGSVVVTADCSMIDMTGGTYRYTYADGEYKLFEADGTTAVSGAKWWVELKADLTMHAMYNAQDKGALVQQSTGGEGGDAPAGENTLAGTTWSATTNFLGLAVTAEFGEDTVVVSVSENSFGANGGTYAYTYDGTNFTTDASGAKFWVEVYPDGLVHAIYNGQDKGALAKQEGAIGGGDDEGDDESAFEGAGTEASPFVIEELPCDFTVDYKVGGYVYYVYTATEDGAMTIAADNNDYWVVVTVGMTEVANNEGNPNPTAVNMTSGNTYLIRLSTWNEVIDAQFGISLTWGETVSGGGDIGGGDIGGGDAPAGPVELYDGVEIDVTAEDIENEVIDAEFMVWEDATYTFTGSDDTIIVIVYNYDDFSMEIGRGTVYLESYTRYSIKIYVGGVEVADTYTIAISYEVPAQLIVGENEVEVTADDIAAEAMEFVFNSWDAGKYVFSADDESVQFQILQDGILVSRFPEVEMFAYTQYTIMVYVGAMEEASTVVVTVEYQAPVGSYGNPDAIETLPATLTVPVADPGYSLYYYTLTLEEETKIVITFENTDSWVTIENEEESLAYDYSQEAYTYTLPAGSYLVALGTWDGTPVETINVTIAVAVEEEGGDEPAVSEVKTWIGAGAGTRAMKVTIDYANKTISVIRAALAGNSLNLENGATEVVYSYTDINDANTYTKVSGSQALTININADGTPNTIVWGSGTYSGWELQA